MHFTSDQQNAIDRFKEFLHNDSQIFILKGYAGTGKTTILKELVKIAQDMGKMPGLMAPTGRAALILQDKTGHDAFTIHRTIYCGNIVEIEEGSDEEESEVMYRFPLDSMDLSPESCVHFVDEASMISSKKTRNEVFMFGSGCLLDDLLTYCGLEKKGKIVFTGDPAQLPPVGDNESNALSKEYLTAKGYDTMEIEMTEVVRQEKDNAILTNATAVRNLLKQEQRNTLKMEIRPGEFEKSDEWNAITRYVQLSPAPSLASPAIICWTNKDAATYNTFIRKRYFPGRDLDTPQIGDRVIMTINRYSNERDIFNGEMAMIVNMAPTTITLSAPVYCKENGNIIKKNVPVTYREMTLEFEDRTRVTRQVVETLLMNEERDLTYEELCSVSINFKIRHKDFKQGSPEDKAALETDPYLNACRAKFGYAITGHKSQGGEWETVFADFSGRTGLKDDSLRWAYTVITRARRTLYATNLPDISPFSELDIMDIKSYSRHPDEAFSYGNVPVTPYHAEDTSPALRAQYFGIEATLSQHDCRILSVRSFPYMERYTIEFPDKSVRTFDGRYNKSYKLTFRCQEDQKDMGRILNLHTPLFIEVNYVPSSVPLKQLYEAIKRICQEEGIVITNIAEHLDNYMVNYYLKTSVQYAYLTIYLNKDGMFSTIIPSATSTDDTMLNNLLETLAKI